MSFSKKWMKDVQDVVVKHGHFQLKSGTTSNVYADFRQLVQHPYLLARVSWELSSLIRFPKAMILGVPLGGLPYVTTIASIRQQPLLLLRQLPKEHGIISENKTETKDVVLIEDVITAGTSVLDMVCAAAKQGYTVRQIVCILDRRKDRSPLQSIPVSSLFDLSFLEPSIVTNDDSKHDNTHTRKLHNAVVRTKSRLIVALDIVNPWKAITVLKKIAPYVCAIKLHLDTFASDTERLLFEDTLQHIKSIFGFLVIEDRKLADIGHVMALQAQALPLYVDFVTCHGITGHESLLALDSISNRVGLLPVVQLSSVDNLIDSMYHARMVNTLSMCRNVAGVISQNPVPGFLTLTPGIGMEKSDNKGQRYRTLETTKADFFIVGRSIIDLPLELVEAKAKEYQEASMSTMASSKEYQEALISTTMYTKETKTRTLHSKL